MRKPFFKLFAVTCCFTFAGSPLRAAVTNQFRPWTEYKTILWIGDTAYKKPEKVPLFFQRLREMGVNTAMVHGDGNLQPLLENKFPYYVENMVNRGLCLKWSSKVTDWDKFVTVWAKSGRPDAALGRDYCLDDPQWRDWARKEMQSLVRKNMTNAPLAYDIRDELSTTVSANPFDYDFHPITLAKFRAWLKTQYPDLAALNAGWETKFATWDAVRPFTTDQIKNRMASGDALPRGQPDWQAVQSIKFNPATARQSPTRWNFAPWCDFRTYMDISLAGALDDLRQAAHALDPRTPVGIEGTQMPSAFGGYDLWRLSQVLDWVEPYDIANAREIFGSFMPGRPMMTTVGESDPNHARRRLWHLLLEGDRGCIVWWSEDCIDWKSDGYALTAKGRALAPVLKEMTSPLAQIFLRATRERDPVFIHYSQPSIQVDWLLESTLDGSTWLRRFSSFEAEHNRMAKVRNSWLKAFQDLGYSPQFVSSVQLERDALLPNQNGVLVLPQSYALSGKEVAAIRQFAQFTQQREIAHEIYADGTPGLFDEHGRLRVRNELEDLFPPSLSVDASRVVLANSTAQPARAADIARFGRDRVQPGANEDWTGWIQKHTRHLAPPVTLPVEARTRIHRYQLGTARLVAFERNVNYQMSEDLKQAGGNETLEKPIDLEAKLAQPAHVYDLRTQTYLGRTDKINFHLDPWQPSLFALLPKKIPDDKLISTLQQDAGRQP